MNVRRAARSFSGLLVFAAAAATLGAGPATASTTPSPSSLQGECPTVMSLGEISTGMKGTALSVTSGRNPVTLNAEALGVLRDAVGPGRDIIVVNLSGSAVTAAGGLWAGASGSPVFFKDSVTGAYEVAGAIAYGLAGGGSTLAGLTPAADMAELLSSGAGGALALEREEIEVPLRLASRMAEAAGLSVAEAGSLTRLLTPLSASGLNSRGLARMRAAIQRENLAFLPYMGSSASTNPPNPTGKLRAGDSFAAAISLGDVTVAGVGTTTWVCGGKVLAFGHPFDWTGETTLAARAADTITIVKDPVWGSYKLANVAESVGTVTQDRLAGIAGTIGAAPPTSPVTSAVTDLDTGKSRTGRSDAVMPQFLPWLSFMHLFQSIDVTIDRIGQGSSEIAYRIRGTRESGEPWEYNRANRYVSPWDISFDSVWEVATDAEILAGFEGEDITVTDIDVAKLDIEQALKQYRIAKVLAWNGKKYASSEVIRAKAGKLIRLRISLKGPEKGGLTTIDTSVRVPKNMRRPGLLEVGGGGGGFEDEVCFFFDCEELGEGDEGDEPTFDEVLAQLEALPRADSLTVRLRNLSNRKVRAQTTRQLDAVVTGARLFVVRITG
ncbi:MAG TPA: hypothetical protein VK915_08160 [Gaiellaceae bacterium]|nr:hypothetical protein [Gaiellaceae bacterium]